MALCWAPALPAAHTGARLVLSASAAKPGERLTAGVHLRMDPGWHTYWRNPGASGLPTEIAWQLPPGITAGEIQWPPPTRHGQDDLVTYGYADEVVLLVPLQLAENLPHGELTLRAEVSWLECQGACLPGRATVQASLRIADATQPSPEAAWLESWRRRLPAPGRDLALSARWDGPPAGASRPLILEWKPPRPAQHVEFFPYAADGWEVSPRIERLGADTDGVLLRATVQSTSGHWPAELAGVLVEQGQEDRRAFEVRLPIGDGTSPGASATPATRPILAALLRALLYGFVGGLILNVMPCVLPVIALKILGFVEQARESPRAVRRLGLVYTAGVLTSFLVLGLLVIALQIAGQKAGWGFQFGNPYFLVAMTTLVTLIALNLFGLFEVAPGGRALEAAVQLASKPGAAGAFFNGLLATVLATSCTAPFLGAALGFGFTQSPPVLMLTLLAVGLGLAAPYLVLSWQPAWLRWLPKPGAWMEQFKVAMGFPMLAAAVWLFSLAGPHYGQRSWWLALFLVGVASAAWVFGSFWQRGRKRRGLALLTVAVLLVLAYAGALETGLRWREPSPPGATGLTFRSDSEGIDWQPWSPAAVAQARAAGRPVLVDFTAQWCLTCQANKKFALETASVRAKLKELNAVALLGDYTRFPPDITEELRRFGRAGVPLVVVYPVDATRPALVLPEALTPGMVLNALEQAAPPRP